MMIFASLARTKLLKPMQLPTAMRGIGPATSSGKKNATVVLEPFPRHPGEYPPEEVFFFGGF